MKTSCDEIRGWLDAYLDDELSTRDHRKVEHHISRCPSCRAVLADLGQMEEALSEEARESDPGPEYFSSFRERFAQRFDLSSARHEWRPPARTAPRYTRLPFRIAPLARVAAVLVLAAALGGVLHRLGTLPLEPRIDLGRTAGAPGGSGAVTGAGSATEGAPTASEAEGVTAGNAAGVAAQRKAEEKKGGAAALPSPAAGDNASPAAAVAEKIPPQTPAPEPRAERPAPDREARPAGNAVPAAPAEPDPAGVASYFAVLESGGRADAGPGSEKRTLAAAREPLHGTPEAAPRFAPAPVPAAEPPQGREMAPSKDRLPLDSTLLLAGEADPSLPDSLWIWSWLATARVRAHTALASGAQADCRSALLAYWRMGNRAGRDLFADPRDRDRAYAADRARIAALLECAGSD